MLSSRVGLPAPLSSFVGRRAEVGNVLELLQKRRLVTITGPGGSGKTRLALEVASRETTTFFAELASLSDPSLLLPHLATALGVTGVQDRHSFEAVARHLAAGPALLLLDNCEHLVEACCSLTAELLGRCPELRTLATSREPLGVPGETIVRLAGLGLADAESLFLERASAAVPQWNPDQASPGAVGAIVRQLDGLPLAIELAAGRVSMMSTGQISASLAESLELLAGGRGRPDRQRTLQSSIDWSYRLLSHEEQRLLRRLAVFPMAFNLDACRAVAGGEVMEPIRSLVDKSLVHARPPEDRFLLLETVRIYAGEALDRAGESADARDAHLRYFASMAAEAESRLWSSALPAALRELEAELANFRAAFDWSLERGDAETGAAMLASLGNLFYVLGLRQEGWRLSCRYLECDLSPRARADVLYWAASFAWYHDRSSALTHATELVELGRKLGDDAILARGFGQLASVQMVAEPKTAVGTADLAIEHGRSADLGTAVVDALIFKTIALKMLGRFRAAFACGKEAMAAAESIDWLWALTFARGLSADAAIELGDFDWALAAAEAVEEVGHVLTDPLLLEKAYSVRALAALYHGKSDALTLLRLATATATACGDDANGRAFELAEGTFQIWSGDVETGSRRVQSVLTTQPPSEALLAEGHALMAEAALIRGDLPAARKHVELANPGVATVRVEARIHLAQGDPVRARNRLSAALVEALDGGAVLLAVDLVEVLAAAFAGLGRYPEAARILGAADASRAEIGFERSAIAEAETRRLMEVLTGALGADLAGAARTAGQRLSLADAAAYARRGFGARARAISGWGSLTPTERRVVALVGAGRSNAEIAADMFVSVATVKSHLTRVFGKLEVGNRRELARAAVADGYTVDGRSAAPIAN